MVGFEVGFIADDDELALAGFQIQHAAERVLQGEQHIAGVRDTAGVADVVAGVQ